MAHRPLEVFVTLAALGGFVYLFWSSRQQQAAAQQSAALADVIPAQVNPTGVEITPSGFFYGESLFSSTIMDSGVTDPVVQTSIIDEALQAPSGVSIFFQRPAPSTSGSNI